MSGNEASGSFRKGKLDLSEEQRERLERIKEECTEDGSVPPPSDRAMLDSLMDTWDAVGDGHYSGPRVDIHLCHHCGSSFEEGQPVVCLSDGRVDYDELTYDVSNRLLFHRDCWIDYHDLHTASQQSRGGQ